MNMTPLHECTPAEDLAVFAEGGLSPERRRAITEHLLACADCYEVMRASGEVLSALDAEGASAPRKRRFLRRPFVPAAAAALVVLISIPLVMFLLDSRSAGGAIAPLLALEEPERLTEGRLAGFEYAAAPAVMRSGTRKPSLETLAAAAAVEKAVGAAADAASLHALALADLAVGRNDEAVRRLEKAVAMEPNVARLNDLAAALIARGRETGAATDFVAAFENADRALAQQQDFAPAAFNRALALESQPFLRDEAIAAWDRYLALDSTSEWAAEAVRRREALREAPVPQASRERARLLRDALESGDHAAAARLAFQAPQEARTLAEVSLLEAWGRGDRAEQARIAQFLAAIGRGLAHRGDSWVSNVARVLATADDAERATLSSGLTALSAARRAYGDERLGDALAQVGAAKRLLAGTPLDAPRQLLEASIRYVRRDPLPPIDIPRDSPSLAARAAWVSGLAAGVSGGRPYEARTALLSAAATLAELGEQSDAAMARVWAAQALELLGEDERSWSERLRVVAEIHEGGADPRSRNWSLVALAEAAHRRGLERYATLLTDVLLQRAGDDVPLAVDALNTRAAAQAALGDASGASASVAKAMQLAATTGDERARERLQLLVDRAATFALRDSEPARAMAHAEQALARAQTLGDVVRTSELRLELARHLRRDGRVVDAERELVAIIDRVDRGGVAVADPALRLAFRDTAAGAVDELVDLMVSAGRSDEALALLARSRSNELRRSLGRAIDDGLARSSAETIVVYAVLDRRTIRWVMRGGDVTSSEIALGNERLNAMVEAFRARLDDQAQAEALFEALLGDEARRGTSLAIVPDKALHALPFAALRDRRTGRRLVESVALTISATPNAARVSRASEPLSTALVISNPTPSDAYREELPSLYGADREARRIAGCYRQALVLEGANATSDRFVLAADDFDVVHFAGHGRTNAKEAGASALFFAPADDDGVLYARDLEALSLSRVRLLVLAGCRTGEGRTFAREGMTGVARAALSAGVATVVATLGDVADAPSAHLFSRFHEAVATGSAPADALRQVQLAMLASNDPQLAHPSAWALVQVMTAGVSRQWG